MASFVELWRKIAADEVDHEEIVAKAPELLDALQHAEVDHLPALLGCLAAAAAKEPAAFQGAELQVAALLLKPPRESILMPAALCVETLALDAECREVFRRSGCLRSLVAGLTSESPDCVQAAAGALSSLSVDERCQAEMASLGILELLVTKMSVKAAECLGHFALQEVYRIRLYHLGVIGSLLKLLEAEPEIAGALAALLNLCAQDECKAAVCRYPGALRLLSSLLFAAAPLNQVAAMLLSSLAEKDSCAVALTDSNCDLALLECLSSAVNEILVEKVLECLLKLTQFAVCRSVLWQEERLKRLLSTSRVDVCIVIQHLAEEAKGRRALKKAGAVHFLRPFLNTAFKEAAAALWNLTAEEDCALELCRSEGVVPLLAHAGSCEALGTLLQMSAQEEVIQQLYEQNAVSLCLEQLKDGGDLALYSAKLLNCMALHMDVFQNSMEVWHGAAYILAQQLRHAAHPAPVLSEICGCSWLLCSAAEEHCQSFVDGGGLWALCILLAEEGPAEPVLGILTALCQQCSSRQEAFLEMDGLQLLLPFLSNSSLRIRHLAAKAVCAVLETEELRRRCLTEEVLGQVNQILVTFK